MKLQTQVPITPLEAQIDYNSKVLLLGSCFSEHIGAKLQYFKFKSLVNPFGILFQPLATETLIRHVVNQKHYTEEDIFFHDDLWHSFEVHSKLSNPSKTALLEHLNTQINRTYSFLTTATHCIITLGTAWAYNHNSTAQYVANCHKVPQKAFQKELLPISTITKALKRSVDLISAVNPEVTVVFTVSPVRHVKDGFVENTISKAHLISGIHQFLAEKTSDTLKECGYFPSYELMIDELRDYRFYKADMIHPNQIAVDYIWERFFQYGVDYSSKALMSEIDSIQKELAHRPLHPNSEAHQKFLKKLDSKLKTFQIKHPEIKF